MEVKESEKRQSGNSSFKSLVIELLFRAIRFFTPLQVTPVLEIENLQDFQFFLLNLSYILVKFTTLVLRNIAEVPHNVKTTYETMILRSI